MRLALLTGLLAPLLTAPETPSVKVEAGTKVTKTFENNLRLELDSISVEVDGEEQEIPQDGLPEVVIADEESIVFVDEYVEVEGGRGTTIVRTFDSLADNSSQTVTLPDGEENEDSSEGESELEGRSVRFVWDGDVEEYTVSFADDEEGSDDLLEDVNGDADFLFMLPDEDVEVGDSWTLDGSVFNRISSPSGDLKIDSEDVTEQDGQFSEQFEDNLSGEIEATLESVEDGVATITFEGVVDTEIEMDMGTPEGAPAGLEVVQMFSFSFDISGTLLWDVETGVAQSMELEADVEMSLSNKQTMEERSILQTQSFEGTFTANATFE